MTVDVLVSTMNKASQKELVSEIKFKRGVIINQITSEMVVSNDIDSDRISFYSFREKGLSRSRNKAIDRSNADIILLSDDDMYYEDDYETTVKNTFMKYKDADIIAFVVDNEDPAKKKRILSKGRMRKIMTMKLQSVQLAFKRSSINTYNLRFDERFGAGSIYPWGEENIFLFDCMRKGLRVYYSPEKIATLRKNDNSSWSRENSIDHFIKQGAIFGRMSSVLWPLFILQFTIRKRYIYKDTLDSWTVFKSLINGAISFLYKNNE